MRIASLLTAAFLELASATPAPAVDPPTQKPATKPAVILQSGQLSPGLALRESERPIHVIGIHADVDEDGNGTAKLHLDPNPPLYDEYGDLITGWEFEEDPRQNQKTLPVLSLDCVIKFVKSGSTGRTNERRVERRVYQISGPKVKSTLRFATTGPGLSSGRLLVHDQDNRVQYVVELYKVDPNVPPVPCHPGCFPAGTPVLVPGGSRAIERLRIGDIVTTVSPEGQASEAAVEHVFTTTNRLIEVRTNRSAALTTDAQPFLLTDGKFRKAGDLKDGDRVWHWRDGRREEAIVREIAATGREERVFNLILGGSATFVAGDFIVRGKPPATTATPAATTAGR